MIVQKNSVLFDNQSEFIAHLEEVKKNTKWETKKLSDLSLVEDVEGIALKFGKSVYPLGEWTLNPLRCRIGLDNADIAVACFTKAYNNEEKYPSLAIKLFKDAISIKKELNPDVEVKMPIVTHNSGGTSVDVIHSFLTPSYAEYIDSGVVYNTLLDMLADKLGILDFNFRGIYDEQLNMGEFTTIEDVGKIPANTTFRIKTSDTGDSSIGIAYGIKTIGVSGRLSYVPMMSDINIPHRINPRAGEEFNTNAFIEKFREKVGELDSVIYHTTATIDGLKKRKIRYPKNAFVALAKEVGLPKSSTLKWADKFDSTKAKYIDNGFDLYVELCSVVDETATIEKWSPDKVVLHTNNVFKTLSHIETTAWYDTSSLVKW